MTRNSTRLAAAAAAEAAEAEAEAEAEETPDSCPSALRTSTGLGTTAAA